MLGIGSSSDRIVERWNGIPFEKPLTRVREAVAGLRPVFAGERGAGGFKLEVPPPEPIPIYVAALRGRMLRLAGEVGDGAWVNFLPLSAVEQVVGEVRAGEQAAGREPGSVDIVCRFFNVPAPPEEGLPFVRFMFAAYATVPVYAEYFRWLGFADQIDPMVEAWEGGDRKRAVELVPEDLARDVFVFGGPDEQRERLAAFAAEGHHHAVPDPDRAAGGRGRVDRGHGAGVGGATPPLTPAPSPPPRPPTRRARPRGRPMRCRMAAIASAPSTRRSGGRSASSAARIAAAAFAGSPGCVAVALAHVGARRADRVGVRGHLGRLVGGVGPEQAGAEGARLDDQRADARTPPPRRAAPRSGPRARTSSRSRRRSPAR